MAELGVEANVVAGAKSQFDVLCDGALVFSKQAAGRLPEPGEVVALVPHNPA